MTQLDVQFLLAEYFHFLIMQPYIIFDKLPNLIRELVISIFDATNRLDVCFLQAVEGQGTK